MVFQKDQVSLPKILVNERRLADAWDMTKLMPLLAGCSSLASFGLDSFHSWVNFSRPFSDRERIFLHYYLCRSWKCQIEFLTTIDWKFTSYNFHCWWDEGRFTFQIMHLERRSSEVTVLHFSSSIWILSSLLSSIWQASNRTRKRIAASPCIHSTQSRNPSWSSMIGTRWVNFETWEAPSLYRSLWTSVLFSQFTLWWMNPWKL